MPVREEEGGWPEFVQPRMRFEGQVVVAKCTGDMEASEVSEFVQHAFIGNFDDEKCTFNSNIVIPVLSETSLDAKTGAAIFLR